MIAFLHHRVRLHLQHNVVAYLALFVALGGSSYAAITVGTDQIRNNSVRSADLRDNDVRGRDVRRATLTGSDLRNDSLTGDDIVESSLGTVPRAASADRAGSADSAGRADSAGNAALLDGRDPSAFVASSRLRAGTGNDLAVPAETILVWPERQITVITDGNADSDSLQLQICARNDAGTGTIGIRGMEAGSISPTTVCTGDNQGGFPGSGVFAVWRQGDARTLLLQCVHMAFEQPAIRCLATDSG
jgi:hypothetical protein